MSMMGPQHKNECHQCGVPMKSWEEHQEHVAKIHGNVWQFKCGFCDLLFDDQTSRLSHRRTHSDNSKCYSVPSSVNLVENFL